jgi:hypothetical protein
VLGFRDALRARRRHTRGTGEFTRRVHVDLYDPYRSQRSSIGVAGAGVGVVVDLVDGDDWRVWVAGRSNALDRRAATSS